MDCWYSCRVLALQSVVAGSIWHGGDHGMHCWWDLVGSGRVSVCRAWLSERFSCHSNSIHKINDLIQEQNALSIYNRSILIIRPFTFSSSKKKKSKDKARNTPSYRRSLEYADRGGRTPKNECSGYSTQLTLVVMLSFLRFRECEVLLHYYYSQVNSDLE